MATKTVEKLSGKTLSASEASLQTDYRDDLSTSTQQYTVFLVEDDFDDRKLTEQTLKKSPFIYNVHSFENGEKLIEHFVKEGFYSSNLTHHLPLMIMLDIHLPGTSGLDVLKKLKQHPLTADIPVIILTGDLSNKAAINAYKSQANAFIVKPLNLDHVHEVIYKGDGWPS